MKITQIIEQLSGATNEAEVQAIYQVVKEELTKLNQYLYLEYMVQNDMVDYDSDHGGRMDYMFANMLSSHYAIDIRFKFENDGLTPWVSLIQFYDGLGKASRNCDSISEDILEIGALPDLTLEDVFGMTIVKAKALQSDYISRLGVPLDYVKNAVDIIWAKA